LYDRFRKEMKKTIQDWAFAPITFLIDCPFGNRMGAAICVVRFQIANEGGRAPSEPGGMVKIDCLLRRDRKAQPLRTQSTAFPSLLSLAHTP
jgi:hypothetical protein